MPDTAAAIAEGSIDPVSRLCSLLKRQLNANAEANAQLKSSGHQAKEQHFQNAEKKQRQNRKQLTAAPTVPVALPSKPALQASTIAAVATPPPPQVLYWPQPQQTLPMNAQAFTTSNDSDASSRSNCRDQTIDKVLWLSTATEQRRQAKLRNDQAVTQ
jgi:hypothetical protein